LNNDGKPELIVAGRDGTVSVLDTQTGETKRSRKVVEESLTAVAAGKKNDDGKWLLVVSTRDSVLGLSGELAQDWTCVMQATGPPVVVADTRETRVLVPARRQPNYAGPPDAESEWGGALVCLDGKGGVVWRDTHSPALLTGAPVVVRDGAGHAACVYAAEDCRVRKVDAPMP
jgi:outer membrane protein assembly factor BamB